MHTHWSQFVPNNDVNPTSEDIKLHNIIEGADSVGGQLRGDKECPSSGVTNSGRGLEEVTESVYVTSLSGTLHQTLPELVTPLMRHSLSPRSCPPTQSVPSEVSG